MKFEVQQTPVYTPCLAEVRIRELDSQIRKAKNKLEALKERKKLLYAKLRLLRHTLASNKNRRNSTAEKDDDEISLMLGQLLSIKLDIPTNTSLQDEVSSELVKMTLEEAKD